MLGLQIRKGVRPKEATRNLCAQIPISLHDRVREERESLGQSLSEYVTQILKEHFEGGKTIMAATKTLAFQIPEELDLRIKNYLAAEKERTGKKVASGSSSSALSSRRWTPMKRRIRMRSKISILAAGDILGG